MPDRIASLYLLSLVGLVAVTTLREVFRTYSLMEAIAIPNDLGVGGGNGHLYVSGVVSGDGDILAVTTEVDGHVCPIEFNGDSPNTLTGALYLDTLEGGAPIVFNKSSGAVVSHRLAVRDGNKAELNIARPDQIDPNATITILAGGKLLLSGNYVAAGNLVLTNFHDDSASSLLDTGPGTLTLQGGITSWVDNGQGALPTIKVRLNLPAVTHSFNIGGFDYAGLDMQAQIVGVGGFNKFGPSALLLEVSNTFSGEIEVSEGILEVRDNHALGSTVGPERDFVLWRRIAQIDSQRPKGRPSSARSKLAFSLWTRTNTSFSTRMPRL